MNVRGIGVKIIERARGVYIPYNGILKKATKVNILVEEGGRRSFIAAGREGKIGNGDAMAKSASGVG